MEEFFKSNYLYLTLTTEILAAVTGIILFKKYNSTAVKFFIYYLIYIVFVDLIGFYPNFYDKLNILKPLKSTIFEYNYWWYSIFFIFGSILFFLIYYHRVIRKKIFKKIILYVGLFTIIFSIIYILLNVNQFFVTFLPLVSVIASVAILTFTTLFFIELLQSDRVLSFYKSINFYISVALFFWWLITTPVVFYNVYNSEADWNFVILRWQILLFSNILMYTTFAIGLIVSKPETPNKK